MKNLIKLKFGTNVFVAASVSIMMAGTIFANTTSIPVVDVSKDSVEFPVLLAPLENSGNITVLASHLQNSLSSSSYELQDNTEKIKKDKYSKEYSSTAMIHIADKDKNHINIYSQADKNSKKIGVLYDGSSVCVVNTNDKWCQITSGDFSGYVATDYVLTGDESRKAFIKNGNVTITIKSDALKVRADKDPSSVAVGMSYSKRTYTVLKYSDNSNRIKLQVTDRISGWISSSEIDTLSLDTSTAVSLKDYKTIKSTADAEVLRTDIIDYAKKFLGNPYKWGGTNLKKGTDCSGFTMRVYEHFGYGLSRTSYTQVNNGTKIDEKDVSKLQPGDLLFYYGTVEKKVKNKSNDDSSNKSKNKSDKKSKDKTSTKTDTKSHDEDIDEDSTNTSDDTNDKSAKVSDTKTSNDSKKSSDSKVTKDSKKSSDKKSEKDSDKDDDYTIVYEKSNEIGHVAIYIGDGKIIHAANENTGIIISNMGNPCAAVRIIK